MRQSITRAILAVVLGTAGGCTDDSDGQEMPNPAAVYCEERGGTVSGPEPMCTLRDGTFVDAWEFYRAENIVVKVDATRSGRADGEEGQAEKSSTSTRAWSTQAA